MEIDEDLKAFLVESNENLSQIERDLVVLEQNPADQELMNRIYRNLHTLKGNSGFLGFDKLQSVAHAGENLLSRLRDYQSDRSASSQLKLNPEITSILLQVVDAVKQILTTLESTGEEGETDYTKLIEATSQLQEFSHTETEENITSLAETTSTTPQQVESSETISTERIAQTSSVTDSVIRVDVELLNKLMNLVGELVLCRNQILEFTNRQVDSALIDTSQRLDLVTTELQEGVMKTRMQMIRTIWSKFPRVVRDLAMSLGKQVRLEMEGEETELDKTLIEAIADPLTHLVRNCVDHGIETPDIRNRLGKPPEGKLFLRAFHESGYVNIEIADDGAGIDIGALKVKAVERGLINPEQAARLSEQEALRLIFLPGFSTAKQVTSLSGRGVGMDVVRTNIEKINGTIDVYSHPNQGTTFKLKIPLTLAIIPTLIVTSGGDRYAIPQIGLLELVRLEGEQAIKGVEMIHGTPVYRLRGQLLPLVYLNQELGLEQNSKSQFSSATSEELGAKNCLARQSDDTLETLNIVVLQATDKPFGLVVDSINDTQEIVVKPLGKQLKEISCFAGATIMGDGRVALILDIQGLAQKAHVISDEEEASLATDLTLSEEQFNDRQMLLLFQELDNRRMAISLSQVARLEKFSPKAIERVGQQKVIQYREQILPLIDLSTILKIKNTDSADFSVDREVQVVVVNIDKEKNVGLIVENIIDIVEEQITIKSSTTQEGVDYAAVIQGRVTEVIDVKEVIQAANLDFFAGSIAV